MADEAENECEECDECPKCPPVGAPAWMATFADMATLLMAFFVLILSFAEMNVPKFKTIQGSMKDAFGVQKIVPVVEQPKGTTVLAMNFSPSPSPSVTKEVTSDTTDTTEPELKIPTDNKDSEGSDQLQEGEGDEEGIGGENADGKGEETSSGQADGKKEDTSESDGEGMSDAEKLAEAIEKMAKSVDIAVQAMGDKVIVDLKAGESSPTELIEKFTKVGQAVEVAGLATGKSESEVLFGGLDQQMSELIEMVAKLETLKDSTGGGPTDDDSYAKQALAKQKAETAQDELKVSLQEEIGKGLVEVERRDNKVFVTLGAGGAFSSGSAVLTEEAVGIVGKIADASEGDESTVKVSGHTDNVPIGFGALYRDNWDLASARATSVVQAVEQSGSLPAERLQAISYGETRPVDDNNTASGREKNRRIEIEIEF
ncbi:MAG: OmpA family protein [Paracoccaceae bacterium]|nr:OmpA family protein [Paracoccaceae bacterium]